MDKAVFLKSSFCVWRRKETKQAESQRNYPHTSFSFTNVVKIIFNSPSTCKKQVFCSHVLVQEKCAVRCENVQEGNAKGG